MFSLSSQGNIRNNLCDYFIQMDNLLPKKSQECFPCANIFEKLQSLEVFMPSCAWHGASQRADCCRALPHSGVCSTGSLQPECQESETLTNTTADEQTAQEGEKRCTVCTPAELPLPAPAHSLCTDGLQAVSHLVREGKGN